MVAPAQIEVGNSNSGVTWDEMLHSDSGEQNNSNPRSERRWLVTGTFDVNDVVDSAPDNIPRLNVVGNKKQTLQGYRYDPDRNGNGSSWIVVAGYLFEVDYFELSFDTSGAKSKALVALDDGDYYNCITPGDPADLTPTGQGTVDFARLIGVNGESVDGVDIPIRKFDFTVLIRNSFATLQASFIDQIKALTGRCNDRPLAINWNNQILRFDTETLLLEGVSGKMTSKEGFELNLKFSEQPSAAGGAQTTATFVQPAVGQAVVVATSVTTASDFFDLLSIIYISGGGHYRVVGVGAPTAADITVVNLGYADNAAPATSIGNGANMSSDENQPITIGNSSPIFKRGWRYVSTNAEYQTVNGRRVLRPSVAVVYKVIPTADFGVIGIFSEVPLWIP